MYERELAGLPPMSANQISGELGEITNRVSNILSMSPRFEVAGSTTVAGFGDISNYDYRTNAWRLSNPGGYESGRRPQ